MIRSDLHLNNAKWIDIVEPNREDLIALSNEINFPFKSLETCLDPEHLPRFESYENFTFLIIRIYDDKQNEQADTVQELTTKLALLISKDLVVTVHRLEQPFIAELRQRYAQRIKIYESKDLIKEIITSSVLSYDMPLTHLETKIEHFEENILKLKKTNKILRDGFLLKRKASVFKKILKLSTDIINKLVSKTNFISSDFQDLRDSMDTLLFYSDDVLDNVNNLLNLHIAMMSQKTNEASYKTNEVVRTLTIFSIFFLPLNFVAGIYGMNFENMPELKNPDGYYYTLGTMCFISVGIFIWILKKGWIRNEDL
jgi:magnesium transporter